MTLVEVNCQGFQGCPEPGGIVLQGLCAVNGKNYIDELRLCKGPEKSGGCAYLRQPIVNVGGIREGNEYNIYNTRLCKYIKGHLGQRASHCSTDPEREHNMEYIAGQQSNTS